jgi:hypothetical protein
MNAEQFARNFANNPFLRFAPPGHFYSPIPDYNDVVARSELLFKRDSKTCLGLEMNENAQLALLDKLAVFFGEMPFTEGPQEKIRYYFKNDAFGHHDAIVLYSMIREHRPRKIIEVGSGLSSGVIMDTNSLFFNNAIECTFIDPYPEQLFKVLKVEDFQQAAILQSPVQDVPLEYFEALSANDILFIDSSHVVKVGSDVAHLFFNVLPRLKPGVIIHFHDIPWPFEYSKEWILEGRAWNEAYFLRAFLSFNDRFKVLYANAFMCYFHKNEILAKMPACVENIGGSFWMRKTGI